MAGAFLVKTVATSDHAKEELLTHYYRNDYQSVKATIIEIAKQMQYEIEHIDDRYQEILLQGRNADIIVVLSNPSYYETAIDLTVNAYFALTKKKGVKIIKDFYQNCNRKLNYKGMGLSNE